MYSVSELVPKAAAPGSELAWPVVELPATTSTALAIAARDLAS